MPLSVSTCHTRTATQSQPCSLATPTAWSNRLAWESCLPDKHHIRSPRFQCALITIIRVSANSVVHCQITKISISILIYLSNLNADATPLAATAILDLRSTQSWFSKSYMQEKCRAINSQSLTCMVFTRLDGALNQLKLENPGISHSYQLDQIKTDPDAGWADLAFTSATPRIADAKEVFEIVIEIQLMVLYAMKIYCKHINGRDMGIFWC